MAEGAGGPPAGRRAIATAVIGFTLAGLGGTAAYVKLRPPAPPGPPRDVRAAPQLCIPPSCERITPRIRLEWRAPAGGGPVAGYAIVRDGRLLTDALGSSATAFVDEAVGIGERFTYEVVARSEGSGVRRSPATTVTVPVPPLSAASLHGAYVARFRVEHATNLSRLLGIRHPRTGDRINHPLRLRPTCPPGRGACPTRWVPGTPPLWPSGRSYRGRFVDRTRAECFGGTRVPVRVEVEILVTGAEVSGGTWIASTFTGRYSISFRCPGTGRSSGTVSFRAHA